MKESNNVDQDISLEIFSILAIITSILLYALSSAHLDIVEPPNTTPYTFATSLAVISVWLRKYHRSKTCHATAIKWPILPILSIISIALTAKHAIIAASHITPISKEIVSAEINGFHQYQERLVKTRESFNAVTLSVTLSKPVGAKLKTTFRAEQLPNANGIVDLSQIRLCYTVNSGVWGGYWTTKTPPSTSCRLSS